ncbi:hypothetical protein Cphy_1771 [Lachnoclostridium phytofermentans ISDg]|uniref:Uncharacterized protein n=1 Tax=Lachnoclostridium phytofermentans (strain ATCC 700394 / DSM 18823 / ISDg) TaxID=357809 RepID=A9KSB1_LACP7|nr:hypothetical protein Cphy_1771 [Lachnoclostridium phytofermentans ISDg]
MVKSRIIASLVLTITRINAEEKNTAKPREILETAAIAIGRVLNGLKANPIAGKNTGADWNSIAIVVKIPPKQINMPIFIFFNMNASYQDGTISKTVPWLKSVTFIEP